ncbi:MAG: T9SS type A sorting domain-containing protein [Prevotellaceae bacterium]|nr:T9SS type A sorting domain-containing protein [Prevotellaceae bacterium]
MYSNPAAVTNVSNALFTLCDMQGRVLSREIVNSRSIISVSGLVAGIYLYNVITEKENRQGKILKQ